MKMIFAESAMIVWKKLSTDRQHLNLNVDFVKQFFLTNPTSCIIGRQSIHKLCQSVEIFRKELAIIVILNAGISMMKPSL